MSDMTQSGDWFEDGSFEDALAHFDAQTSEPTIGPLPGNARFVVAVASIGGVTVQMPTPTHSVGHVVGAALTRA